MPTSKLLRRVSAVVLGAALAAILNAPASAQSIFSLPFGQDGAIQGAAPWHTARPLTEEPASVPQARDELPPALRRQVVFYPSNEPPGTIIIDTAHTFLYLTLGGGKALRYGIGVGRQGFTWSAVETISRKAEWPDWTPPAEMIARQPYLPRWVAGGPGNPLGARALYLGDTAYRIHGTNNPASIGKHVSSGCIRLRDADVIDLYNRVGIGTKVIVLANGHRDIAGNDRRRVPIQTGQRG